MKNKVLIIEDDQIFANVYRDKLVLDGFEVEVGSSGQTGLEQVRSFGPDAILLDLMLPDLPGLEVIRRIRQEPRAGKLPILVFTNTYLTRAAQEAWKAGATQCMTRAECTPRQVIESLRGVLRPPHPGETDAPPPAPAATATHESGASDTEAEFQAGLRSAFLESLPATLATLRSLLQNLIRANGESIRLQQIQQLHRRVHAIAGHSCLAGLEPITRIADALEALLKELHDKPKNLNASSLRTVASAIDLLGTLFELGPGPRQAVADAAVLVVDDETVSLRAIAYALEKARLKSVSVEDPLRALERVADQRFDLIFLDVDMPKMNGFELWNEMRSRPSCQRTPVVFVTNLNDFESRVHSSMDGGTDFIAKPFLFVELSVKALVYVLRARLETAAV